MGKRRLIEELELDRRKLNPGWARPAVVGEVAPVAEVGASSRVGEIEARWDQLIRWWQASCVSRCSAVTNAYGQRAVSPMRPRHRRRAAGNSRSSVSLALRESLCAATEARRCAWPAVRAKVCGSSTTTMQDLEPRVIAFPRMRASRMGRPRG